MENNNLTILNKENFDDKVLNSKKLAVVDFWAQWCGPCRTLMPIMEEVAANFSEKADFYKVNVDEESEIAQKYKIMSIPTVILFKNGEAVQKVIGVKTKEEYIKLVEEVL